jgi:hypothetical protein
MRLALEKFLREESSIEYKPFKARILSVDPTRLTEDNKESLEVPNFLTPQESEKFKNTPATHSEASIEQWRLEPLSNPNTQGPIATLVPIKYSLGKPSGKAKPKATLPSLLESKTIAYSIVN